jgi:peptide-methionine (S)-S-oxide reductase
VPTSLPWRIPWVGSWISKNRFTRSAKDTRVGSKTSYEKLLKLFWESHDPTQGMRQGNDMGSEYRSAIFVHDDEQRRLAEASRDAYQKELSAKGYGQITTEIAGPPAPPFYFAEDYHQQYLDKNPYGYCPNHSTGVKLPDVVVTPLQYVD